MRKALIVWGGWDGHEPEQVAAVCKKELEKNEFQVEVSDTLDTFLDEEKLNSLHLIVPIWTMGEITKEQCTPVIEAVANGCGIAGCHGGMCDAFRNDVRWQFMTGGNWVSHPGGDGIEYTVNISDPSSPLTAGMKDFTVKSEQYYLHIDPAVEILATTRLPVVRWYHSPNGDVKMPVAWTKKWGVGRVFYTSLGHHADVFEVPEALTMFVRGMVWAAEGKEKALFEGLSSSIYKSDLKMF